MVFNIIDSAPSKNRNAEYIELLNKFVYFFFKENKSYEINYKSYLI